MGAFVSDSLYSHIYIGNFFDDTNVSKTQIKPAAIDQAYYFIDDVCVSTDSIFTANYIFTNIHDQDRNNLFSVYPNPINDKLILENPLYGSDDYEFSITNLDGGLILDEKVFLEKKKTVDLKFLNPGIYFLTIKSLKQTKKYKLIKL